MQLSDLAAVLRIDLSVASRHASNLANAGYVERAVHDGDRRARTIKLTESGRELLMRAEDHLAVKATSLFGDWSPDELEEANAMLQRIAASLRSGARNSDFSSITPS